MSARKGIFEQTAMVVAIVLIGFFALVFTQSIFMLIFAPLIVYVIWSDNKRIKELEKRLDELQPNKTAGNDSKKDKLMKQASRPEKDVSKANDT